MKNRLLQKLLVAFMLVCLAACPYVFIGSMFFPPMVDFLDPVVCPGEPQMEFQYTYGMDRDGSYKKGKTYCVDDSREVDVSWKTLLIMLGLPALGVVVFFIVPTPSDPEEKKITLNPDG